MSEISIRKATREDLPYIVEMLADDALGQQREDYREPLPEAYYRAFDKILNDQHQELMVAVNKPGKVVGTLQLSFIQYLTYQGGIRAQVEAVRIHKAHRGKGLGKLLMEWAIGRAKDGKAHVLQLTTDKQRPKAIRFYESLGFKASHEGMKMHFIFPS